MKVVKTQCATCPFRVDSPYAYLLADLSHKSLFEASRICHSTGSNNAINRRTGKPPMICRGARDHQLQFFHRIGFLDEATDACWEAKIDEIRGQKKVKKS